MPERPVDRPESDDGLVEEIPDAPKLLPILDEEPEEWGPDHDELVEKLRVEDHKALRGFIIEGNRQGREIDPDDDEDNGLQ